MVESWESKNKDNFPILQEEEVEAITALKKGKAAGFDNTPAELIQKVERQ